MASSQPCVRVRDPALYMFSKGLQLPIFSSASPSRSRTPRWRTGRFHLDDAAQRLGRRRQRWRAESPTRTRRLMPTRSMSAAPLFMAAAAEAAAEAEAAAAAAAAAAMRCRSRGRNAAWQRHLQHRLVPLPTAPPSSKCSSSLRGISG